MGGKYRVSWKAVFLIDSIDIVSIIKVLHCNTKQLLRWVNTEWDYFYYIYFIISFSVRVQCSYVICPFSSFLPYAPPCSPSNSCHLFSLIVVICIPTNQERQTDTLLSLYVTCVYVFKANHLALVNQLVLSSLGKTITPKSRIFFFLKK